MFGPLYGAVNSLLLTHKLREHSRHFIIIGMIKEMFLMGQRPSGWNVLKTEEKPSYKTSSKYFNFKRHGVFKDSTLY